MSRRPVIVAHRGATEHAPANSHAACEKALHLGADVIEVDVRLTRDHMPVLLHPYYLDGPSGTQAIFNHNFQHVRANFPDILRLEEWLEAFAGRVGLEIELKGPELDAVAVVAQALLPYRRAWPSIWVTFQDFALMTAFGARRPEVTRVLHNTRFEPWMTRDVRVHLAVERARATGSHRMQLHSGELEADLVDQLTSRGLELRIGAVNDQEAFRQAATLGIPRMTTDRLEMAIRMNSM